MTEGQRRRTGNRKVGQRKQKAPKNLQNRPSDQSGSGLKKTAKRPTETKRAAQKRDQRRQPGNGQGGDGQDQAYRTGNGQKSRTGNAKTGNPKTGGRKVGPRTGDTDNRKTQNAPINVLFVCDRNRWRSSTAETVWRNRSGVRARSAGTGQDTRRKVSSDDLRWADLILVMEQEHKDCLLSEFSPLLTNKPLYVLDVPDEYQHMEPELVSLFEDIVPPFLIGFNEARR